MKTRACEVGAFSFASVAVSFYVGGMGLAFIFSAAIFLWAVFNAYSVLPAHSRYLGSLVISAILPVVVASGVLPAAREVGWIRNLVFAPPTATPADYFTGDPASTGAVNHWIFISLMSLAVISVLPLVGVTRYFRNKASLNKNSKQSLGASAVKFFEESRPAVSRYVVLVPLLAFAWLQKIDRVKAITFTMSGDARNVFLQIMRTRVNSSFPSPAQMLSNGRFGETLAASISTANRTVGYPRLADQIALRSTYVLVVCLIAASVAVLIIGDSSQRGKKREIPRDCAIIALACFSIFNPYPMAEILRSGFFSLFVSLGFLAAILAFLIPKRVARLDEALLVVLCAGTVFFSYQMTALLVIPSVVLSIILLVRCRILKRSHRYFFVAASAVIALFVVVVAGFQLADRFSLRVRDGGAITPTVPYLTAIMLGASLVLLIFVRREFRRMCGYVCVVGGSGLLTILLIRWARHPNPDLDGYYGMKFMYASNFAVWLTVVAVIGVIGREIYVSEIGSHPASLHRVRVALAQTITFGVLVTALVYFGVHFSSAQSPVTSVRDGWNAPSEEIIQATLNLWERGEENYIFAQYYNDGNDRLGNFWSPYFWERNRWEWTYIGYDVSPTGLCGIIGDRRIRVVTKSAELKTQMETMCPDVSATVTFSVSR